MLLRFNRIGVAYLRNFGYLRTIVLVVHCGLVSRVFQYQLFKEYAFEDNNSQNYIHRRSPLPDRSTICRISAFQSRTDNGTCHLPVLTDCRRYICACRTKNAMGCSQRNVYQPGRFRPTAAAEMVHYHYGPIAGGDHYRVGNRPRLDITPFDGLCAGSSCGRSAGESENKSFHAPRLPCFSGFYHPIPKHDRRNLFSVVCCTTSLVAHTPWPACMAGSDCRDDSRLAIGTCLLGITLAAPLQYPA